MIANDASFSSRFSTYLRLSRGAQLSYEINHGDLSGRDPLPAYARSVTVSFSPQRMSETKVPNAYTLVDREVEADEREIRTEQRNIQETYFSGKRRRRTC